MKYRYDIAKGVQKIKTKTFIAISALGLLLGGGGLSLAIFGSAHADTSNINFETSQIYSIGNINGQNGWSALGSAGSGCAVYDEGVSSSLGTTGFADQSFRISNAVTSGCFGDQAFAPKLSQWAGEAGALDDTNTAVASPQPYFESQFDIASTTHTEQNGLAISVSPDNGKGARMSYLSFKDESDGIHVTFYDVEGVNIGYQAANFVGSDIATLSYNSPHTIKFSMDFVPGPSNDIVKIYIDGTMVHQGISWENYYRYDYESQGGVTPDPSLFDKTRAVDTMLFRAGGAPAPSTLGNGYLIDNLNMLSGPVPKPTSKDQCIKNGWQSYGSTFKNQGDCVSYVATGGTNQPSGPAKH